MKILFLSDGVWPNQIGGIQKHTYNTLKNWGNLNDEITLVSSYDADKKDVTGLDDEFEQLFPKNVHLVWVPFPVRKSKFETYTKESKQLSLLMYERIKSEINDFDLIYCQGFTAYIFIKRGTNLPVITNLHGLEMFQNTAGIKHYLQMASLVPLAKYVLKNSDYVISLGGKLTEILISLNIPKHKVFVQPNGIDLSWIRNSYKERNLAKTNYVYIGRYERRKGITEINKAVDSLLNEGFEGNFQFVGDIPEDKKITNGNVFYCGTVQSEDELKRILDSSDVLICPSWSEGMPTVILEAYSRGLFVICTDVGAVSSIVKGDTFLWTKVGDTTDLKNKIIESKKKIELGYNPLHSIENAKGFIWENIVSDMRKDFLEIVTKKA